MWLFNAPNAKLKILDGRITGADKRGTLENFEKKCVLDTMGMVEILRVLREMADK